MFAGVLINGKNCFKNGTSSTTEANLLVKPVSSSVKVFSALYFNASELIPFKPVSSKLFLIYSLTAF